MPPVERAQGEADRLQAEIGAAALVGDREAVAADAQLPCRPRGASPKLPVPTMTMPPSSPEWAPMQATRPSAAKRSRRRDAAAPSSASHAPLRPMPGEADARSGCGPAAVEDSPASATAASTGGLDRGHGLVEPEPRRGGSGDAGAEHVARRRPPACAAAGAAAVDADVEGVTRVRRLTTSIAPDARAAAHELAVQRLVAAVEVVDAVHHGLALGDEAGEHQADRGAQVRRHHRRARAASRRRAPAPSCPAALMLRAQARRAPARA